MKMILIILLVVLIGCKPRQEQNAEGRVDSTEIAPGASADPLPSWNDGPLKDSIVSYVSRVTKKSNSDFIPVTDRIATFDNDGTLWSERPYVQELFARYMVKKMVEKNPALAQQQPFMAVINRDTGYFTKGGEKAVAELIAVTHTGMTEDEFDQSVKDFFSTMTYPGRNVKVQQIVYQPQIELLNYLRVNGFKTFICSGGTVEFMRGISQQLYGVPKEQVIGTTFKYKFVDSNRSIIREPAIDMFNDKESKPVTIQQHVGQRPVFACGNEGGAGDIAMLKYSQGSKYPSFQMIINHDDSTREFFYTEKDNASLKAAAANNWHVVSMKDDWKTVFPLR
jgi:hypothetical protein